MLAIVCVLTILILSCLPVFASGADTAIPSNVNYTNTAAQRLIDYAFFIEWASTDSQCLNQLCSSQAVSGTNITTGNYTANSTQWFRHYKYYVVDENAQTYNVSSFVPSSNTTLAISIRRTGSQFVNVMTRTYQCAGDVNVIKTSTGDLRVADRLNTGFKYIDRNYGDDTGYGGVYTIWVSDPTTYFYTYNVDSSAFVGGPY